MGQNPLATKNRNKVLPPSRRSDVDWFAQQESDWFSEQEKLFETEQQLAKSQPTPLGAGPLGAPQVGGRTGGAGPMQQNAADKGNSLDLPDVGGFMRENLPLVAGTIGSGAAAYATGGMSIPLQALIGVSAAGTSAGLGELGKYEIREAQGLPAPPTVGEKLKGAGSAALTEGVLPEVMGQGTGTVVRFGGNVISRIGAAAKNSELVQRLANPKNIRMSPGGREVGKRTQDVIEANRRGAKDPLSAKYDELLSSPFGHARQLDYAEGGYGEPLFTQDLPTQFTMQEAPGPRIVDEGSNSFTIEEPPTEFSITEKGPTIAARHQKRSDALEDARSANKRDDSKAARRERAKAETQWKEMEKAAQDNGMTMDEYKSLNDAWAKVTDQYDNTFMRQIKNKKGSNFIDMLSNPRGWKSFKSITKSEGSGTIETVYDNPDLVRNLRSTLDNASWERLTTAVQKKIVRDATDTLGDIKPDILARKLRDMVDYGAKDLVPNYKELTQFAQILKRHTGGPLAVPKFGGDMGMTARLIKMSGFDNALTVPDVGRKMNQARTGYKGRGQRTTERIGSLGTAAALADYSPDKIPDPPK